MACERATTPPTTSAASTPEDPAAQDNSPYNAPSGGPIKLGEDECAQCAMIIEKPGCGAVLIIDRSSGAERRTFDDLGCFFDYLHEHREDAAVRAVQGFVVCLDRREGVAATSAIYVVADPQDLATPMSSGMVAVARRATADRVIDMSGGNARTLDFAGAAAHRRAFMEQRYGKPVEAPQGR